MDKLGTWREGYLLPGPASGNADLGHDDEADGDDHVDDGDEASPGLPGTGELVRSDEDGEETEVGRQLALEDLLGSRPPAVLLRIGDGDPVTVRVCAAPASPAEAEALELLRQFVVRRFTDGRPHFTEDEWDQLLGHADAPLTRRLTLLLRLAVKANEKVGLGGPDEGGGAAFTPHDVGLERFANKFAALPDGTPFSIRLLLLDERGRPGGDTFFDRLPDAVRLLALRRALGRERATGVAVSDNEIRAEIQQALEELLGAEVPKPTVNQVRRQLRDHFRRNRLGDLFPNQTSRQQKYDENPPPSSPGLKGGS
jgi:hypothetical protein